MEKHAEEASEAVNSAHKKLHNALRNKEPDYESFDPLLEKLRIRSGNLALLSLTTDQPATDIEQKLWDSHVDVNSRFKVLLRTFQEGAGKRKHVERRKAEKLYVDFIKASQRFYRAYVERLTANFTNIPKVLEVAQKLGKNSLTTEIKKPAGDALQQILERSCKQTIIRLGDLSRWRETQLQLKERNWGPAKGYYDLALTLDPAEGTCYNQLAVIALQDADHLGAVYYLHQAAVVDRPFPTAVDNIKTEFEKVLKLYVEESYGLLDRSGDDIVCALEKRFLAFHAHCYAKPYDFVAFQQKASDILSLIVLCFQDTNRGGFDHFLSRACLVNIAAETIARQGMEKSLSLKKLSAEKLAEEIERSCQSYFLLQRFNLMAFRSLLRILARELGEPEPGDNIQDLSRLSPAVRRVLPHLRQYSSWFLSHFRELAETRYKSTRRFLEQVMQTHAQTLNLLRDNVDIFTPSQIVHLLDEDEKTLSFAPFSPEAFKFRYYQNDMLKSRRLDDGRVKGLEEELAETHLRATDLVVDVLRLIQHKDDLNVEIVPFAIENSQIVAQGIPEVEPPRAPPTPPASAKKWRGKAHAQAASINGLPESPAASGTEATPTEQKRRSDLAPPRNKTSKSKANGTHHSQNMDDTGITFPTTEPLPATLNSSNIEIGTPIATPIETSEPAAPALLTAMDFVRQMQQRTASTSPAFPRSPDAATKFGQPVPPSVYNTPFAPTADEQRQLSPRLEHHALRSPSFAVPEINSSNAFQDSIAKQQREVHLRSPPQPPFQATQSWNQETFGQTPTALSNLFSSFEKGRTPSPFRPMSPGSNHMPSRNTAQQAPFGVIGQARPVSGGTPTSGQG